MNKPTNVNHAEYFGKYKRTEKAREEKEMQRCELLVKWKMDDCSQNEIEECANNWL